MQESHTILIRKQDCFLAPSALFNQNECIFQLLRVPCHLFNVRTSPRVILGTDTILSRISFSILCLMGILWHTNVNQPYPQLR